MIVLIGIHSLIVVLHEQWLLQLVLEILHRWVLLLVVLVDFNVNVDELICLDNGWEGKFRLSFILKYECLLKVCFRNVPSDAHLQVTIMYVHSAENFFHVISLCLARLTCEKQLDSSKGASTVHLNQVDNPTFFHTFDAIVKCLVHVF